MLDLVKPPFLSIFHSETQLGATWCLVLKAWWNPRDLGPSLARTTSSWRIMHSQVVPQPGANHAENHWSSWIVAIWWGPKSWGTHGHPKSWSLFPLSCFMRGKVNGDNEEYWGILFFGNTHILDASPVTTRVKGATNRWSSPWTIWIHVTGTLRLPSFPFSTAAVTHTLQYHQAMRAKSKASNEKCWC